MKRVEANIRPEKLEDVLKAVKGIGVGGLMVRKWEQKIHLRLNF